MHTMETDRLVDEYLRRLERAATHMQRARRAELVAEIRGHIDTALSQEQAAGEAAVRNVLDRLGPPEDIVDAAEPPPRHGDQRAGKLEIVALAALIVPVIGWLIGAVLVFASRIWSRRDKLIAAVLLLLPIVVLSLSFVAARPSGNEDSTPPGDTRTVGEKVEDPIEPGLEGLVLLVAGLPSALYLGWQLRRDPATSPAES
jgi:HAAS